MNDTIFRLLATIIFLSTASISIYHRRRADREGGRVSLEAEGKPIFIALRLFGFSMWLMIIAYLINPAWVAWGKFDLPDWARWLGVLMGILSAGLAYWVFSTLGSNVTPTVVTRANHTLVTDGPYRWVRHPLYVMGLIACVGYALIAENWVIAALAVLSFVILMLRLPMEEARLIATFGDQYRAYMQRTGKLFPRF
jgi:protein-S-isoprenylcysteine O-methyltransferase Ste14